MVPDATTTCTYCLGSVQVAIPISKAGSCLMEVGKEVYGQDKLWDGARTPFLVRFVT